MVHVHLQYRKVEFQCKTTFPSMPNACWTFEVSSPELTRLKRRPQLVASCKFPRRTNAEARPRPRSSKGPPRAPPASLAAPEIKEPASRDEGVSSDSASSRMDSKIRDLNASSQSYLKMSLSSVMYALLHSCKIKIYKMHALLHKCELNTS